MASTEQEQEPNWHVVLDNGFEGDIYVSDLVTWLRFDAPGKPGLVSAASLDGKTAMNLALDDRPMPGYSPGEPPDVDSLEYAIAERLLYSGVCDRFTATELRAVIREATAAALKWGVAP